jgi:aminoglycoside phosphotransferase (APT) family kinase protein
MGALGSAIRLLAQLFWIAFDLFAGPRLSRNDGVPVTPRGVDAAWLTRALQPIAPGIVVTRVERIEGHSGTTTRERIRVVTDEAGRRAGLPASVFLKITPASLGTRLFTSLLGLGAAEVDFYRVLGGSLPVRAPRVFCARRPVRGGRFVLVLEDLAATGCRFTDASHPISLAEARAVVVTLAHLHAAFWESPRFTGDLAWLRSPENNPHRRFEWWISSRSNGPALARFGDAVPDEVRENAHRVHAHRPLLEAHWARAPRTLIHGDPHAGNLYFDGDEAGFFDWQVVQAGPGLRDVSYFLVNSVDTELRRRHEGELLALYLATLSEGGVRGLEFADAWEGHRLFALYTWIAISVTAATSGLQARGIVRRAIERTGAALQDLGSFDALDTLLARVGTDVLSDSAQGGTPGTP